MFACSFRLTGRLHRVEPELSRVLLNNVLRLLSADNGLAPRARRDIAAAVDAGRFDVDGSRRRGHDGRRRPRSPSANCCTTSQSATSSRPPTG